MTNHEHTMHCGYNSDPFHRIALSLNKRDPILPEEYANIFSSLRDYFFCDHCLRKFRLKTLLINHLTSCKSVSSVTCEICQIKFTNKGNLAHHAMTVHKDLKYNRTGPGFACAVCQRNFTDSWKLMRHVRNTYFNMSHVTCTHTTKSVNEIWVEKVLNSNMLVEMKKVKKNLIVMRKCDSSKVDLIEEAEVLVSKPRMASGSERVPCQFCNKIMMKKSLGKHINERHWSTKVHMCKNCGFKCKRPYQLLKHVCGVIAKRGRKKRTMTDSFEGSKVDGKL